jgi:hypothetical protein
LANWKRLCSSLHSIDYDYYDMMFAEYDYERTGLRYVYRVRSQPYLYRWNWDKLDTKIIVNTLNLSIFHNHDFTLCLYDPAQAIPRSFDRPTPICSNDPKKHDDRIQDFILSLFNLPQLFSVNNIIRIFHDYLVHHPEFFIRLLLMKINIGVDFFENTDPIHMNLVKTFIKEKPLSLRYFSEDFLNKLYQIEPGFFHDLYSQNDIVRDEIRFEIIRKSPCESLEPISVQKIL